MAKDIETEIICFVSLALYVAVCVKALYHYFEFKSTDNVDLDS